MNAGEPLNEEEAEQMMKEADKDGDGTIDYEGEKNISVQIYVFFLFCIIIKTSLLFNTSFYIILYHIIFDYITLHFFQGPGLPPVLHILKLYLV